MDITYRATGDVMRNGKNEDGEDRDNANTSCSHFISAPISWGGFVIT